MSQQNQPVQRLSIQHEAHILPITALAYLTDNILLAGEGSFLCAYDVQACRCLRSWQVFEDQALHGIVGDETGTGLLVYGGRFAKVIEVDLGQADDATQVLNISQSHVIEAEDWILDAIFANSQGTLLTAHNALYNLERQHANESIIESIWKLCLLVPGANTILYSAHILEESGRLLIAAGTAFGDIIVWSYVRESSAYLQSSSFTVHYTFSAHEGSTFGVYISEALPEHSPPGLSRLLITCSDDRTVKVWDLSNINNAVDTSVIGSRTTGFGTSTTLHDINSPPLLARAMGHVSRIWHVRLDCCTDEEVLIRSFGEDATTISWSMRVDSQQGGPPYTLRQLSVFGANSGKHIWSVAKHLGDFVLGGADGAIVRVPAQSRVSSTIDIDIGLTGVLKTPLIKAYVFLDRHTIFATTQDGKILVLQLDSSMSRCVREFSVPQLAGYSIVASAAGVGFAAGSRGNIYALDVSREHLTQLQYGSAKVATLHAHDLGLQSDGTHLIALVITIISRKEAIVNLLSCASNGRIVLLSKVCLHLLDGFVVTSSTAAALEHGTLLLALGSRSGSIALYQTNTATIQDADQDPLLTLTTHTEAVTCLMWKQSIIGEDCKTGHLLSTSRDGTYAVQRVDCEDHNKNWRSQLLNHLELPLGPNIECLRMTSDDQLLVGAFRSKQFVVYSVNRQQEIYSIDCGGAHRTWAFDTDSTTSTFVWTKASKVYCQRLSGSVYDMIRTGGHGREIKSMAITDASHDTTLIATGGQDTDVRLFTFGNSSPHSAPAALRCLHILRKHNTGPQHLAFADNGQYLFSSGGFEEFFIWKTNKHCPIVDVGVICESVHPRSGQSDLRITSFNAQKPQQDDNVWHISMAYSDSRIALWMYELDVGWSHITDCNYLTSCPTSILDISPQTCSTKYLTTATDGHLALWSRDDEHTLRWSDRYKIHSGAILTAIHHRLADNKSLVITGGDDNAIAFSHIDAGDSSSVATQAIRRAHAAAVTALYIIYQAQESVLWLFSAGLDQRLILWRLTFEQASPQLLKISKVCSISTSVADISSIGLVATGSNAASMLVTGVGMEVWKFPLS